MKAKKFFKIKKKVLVSISGGADSVTLLYLCKKRLKEVEAVTFNYGSRQNEIEYKYAEYHCAQLGISLTRINLESLFKTYDRCILLNKTTEVPQGEYKNTDCSNLIVPFRNGIFLSVCASIAESKNCDYIALASHKSDWVCYPDCRPEFTKAIKKAIKSGTVKNIKVYTPFVTGKNRFTGEKGYSKTEIVRLGLEYLNMTKNDYLLTYSCYKGNEEHCGECPTCKERIEAFKANGIEEIGKKSTM